MERYDTTKTWSINDSQQGARSLDEISKYAKSKKFNCKAVPLFPFIPIDHVIIDTLHLFLRISDNLIELLIRELTRQDAVGKLQKFPNGFQREKHKHMAFSWKINKDTKKLEYRDLTGPEKLILFQHINFSTLLPSYDKCNDLEKLWSDFIEIIGDLKLTFTSEESIINLKSKIKNFFSLFLTLYQSKDVTPYMHALNAHVPEFLSLYKNIAYFTQQGMEKINDTASKDYFRSTNHTGISALKQLFLKKNRIHFLEAEGCERVKARYRCKNCSKNSHNIKTCTEKFTNCGFATCCAHLKKVNNVYIKKCLIAQ